MLAGDPALDCFREECFAPVVCIAPFDNEADAITKANASAYALGAERCRSLSVKSFSVRSAEPKQQESQPQSLAQFQRVVFHLFYPRLLSL